MKNNLISQFQGKTVLSAILDALNEELAEISAVASDLKNKRWIDTGFGVTLDGIGDIVGQSRIVESAVTIPFFGFYGQPSALGFGVGRFRDSGETWQFSSKLGDAEYKKLLWAKVFKNVSQCTTEDTIQALRFIFSVEKVIVEDAGNAKIRIGIGRELSASEIALAKAYCLMIRAGGVGIDEIVQFDADAVFGFLGQPNIKGFELGKFADNIDISDGTLYFYFGFAGQEVFNKVKGFEEGVLSNGYQFTGY